MGAARRGSPRSCVSSSSSRCPPRARYRRLGARRPRDAHARCGARVPASPAGPDAPEGCVLRRLGTRHPGWWARPCYRRRAGRGWANAAACRCEGSARGAWMSIIFRAPTSGRLAAGRSGARAGPASSSAVGPASTAEQEVIALQWKPFRSVAARILWHHYLSTRQTRAVSGEEGWIARQKHSGRVTSRRGAARSRWEARRLAGRTRSSAVSRSAGTPTPRSCRARRTPAATRWRSRPHWRKLVTRPPA